VSYSASRKTLKSTPKKFLEKEEILVKKEKEKQKRKTSSAV
jgi:hypothetical protein